MAGYMYTCPNARCRRKLGPYRVTRPGLARCAYCGTTFRVR